MGTLIAILVGVLLGAIFFDHNNSLLGLWLGGLSGGLIAKVMELSQKLHQLQLTVAKLGKVNKAAPQPTPEVPINNPVEVMPQKVAPQIQSFRNEVPQKEVPQDASPWETEQQEASFVPPPLRKETPKSPGLLDQCINLIQRFFTEGNPIVRVGMVVMFFGLSYLVKYASSLGFFPIEFRLSCVLVFAIAMIVLGWKTRHRAGGYGLVLQGGGVAAIYLTLFAAAKIFGLLPLGIAFALLFVVVLLGSALALLQNAQVLAILSTAGGFLAPILTSTGEGSHVALFSFYILLNVGILTVAWYKAWRLLNWVGFIFTFVITSTWGVLKYEPTLYLSTQPFLVSFFLLYLTIAILFSFKQPPNLKGFVDGSLVFGLPLVGFGLQICLLKHSEYGLPVSAVCLSALYLALTAWLARQHLESHRVLVESFLALGVGFATLAVPLALDASWTSATWALEAAGLVWVGFRQERLRPRVVGYLLYGAAVVSLMVKGGINAGDIPLIRGDFINVFLLALTAFSIAYTLHRHSEKRLGVEEKFMGAIALAAGFIAWFMAGIQELQAHVISVHHYASILFFASVSATVVLWISQRIQWEQLRNGLYALLPFVIILFANHVDITGSLHPLHGLGVISILAFVAIQYRFLFLVDASGNETWLNIVHTLTAWFLLAIVLWESLWRENFHALTHTDSQLLWFATFTFPFLLLLAMAQKMDWPFKRKIYKQVVPAPLFIASLLWFLTVCDEYQKGWSFYFPLINPLDISQLAVIVLFAYVFTKNYFSLDVKLDKTWRLGLLGVMLFVWVNVVMLRALHHYLGIPYEAISLWASPYVQMALSILWSVCALIVMNTKQRTLWIVGAVLLGAVVLKLATKDLTATGTLARIVSFMGVGGLMLLIGYLSPIPAKDPSGEKT